MDPTKAAEVLELVGQGLVSRAEAAAMIEVTVRTINRLMKAQGVVRPTAEYLILRENAQKRREIKQKQAILTVKGDISIEKAAKLAECSTRTIYRYRKKSLAKGLKDDR